MKKNLISIIFIVILITTITFTIIASYKNNGFINVNSPDALQTNLFASSIVENKEIIFCVHINNSLADNILGSRGLFYVPNMPGCLTHSNQHGFILIVAMFKSISELLLPLINPLFFILIICYIYLITNLIYKDKKSTILSIIIFILSPVAIFYSINIFNNLAESLFLLMSIYYFLKWKESNNNSCLILMSITLALATWIRYPSILYILPFILILIMEREKIKLRSFIVPIAIFFILILMLLILNFHLYGTIFGSVSTNLDSNKSTANADYYFYDRGESIVYLLPFYGFDIYLSNVFRYLILIFIPISLFVFASFFSGIFNKKNIIKSYSLITFFIVLINTFIYFGSIWNGYHFNFLTVGNSYVRYFTLPYILMIILVSKNIKDLLRKNHIFIFLIMIVLIFSFINFSVNANSGILSTIQINKRANLEKNNLLSQIPEKAIVFTVLKDKYLFPERMTAIYSSYPEEDRINLTTSAVLNLLNLGYSVYFLDDGTPNSYDIYPIQSYFEEFENHGINITKIDSGIYQLSLQNNTK